MFGQAGQAAAQDLLTLHPPGRTVVPVQELGDTQTGEDLLTGVGRTERSHLVLNIELQQGGELGPANIIDGKLQRDSHKDTLIFDM